MGKKILVVDDEKEITDLIEVYLQNEGYSVKKCYNGEQALEYIVSEPVDLAVIDIMMPMLNGFDLCRKIREKFSFPIIMLTAKFDYTDKINGLAVGADDYVTKPFHPLELTARIKAQLRRTEIYNTADDNVKDEIIHRGIVINKGTHKCTLNGKELQLTPIEFEILWMLCSNPNQVINSEKIFESIWKEKYFTQNKTVMVHIRHLREKMGEPMGNPQYIKTVWGVGYKIE